MLSLFGLKSNVFAIHKHTNDIGKVSEKWLENEELRATIDVDKSEIIYAQVDGGMVCFREESWREVKLGRVFRSQDVCLERPDRGWIRRSEYVAHVGGHQEFENKMAVILDRCSSIDANLVFVTDGAKWIENWIKREYPKAQRILDYYHVMEHIGNFLSLRYEGNNSLSKKIETQANKLLKQGPRPVIKYIQRIKVRDDREAEDKHKLLNYLKSNIHRMNYPEYRARGLIIGSGAIEAAHKTVVQKRCKLSGQRWSRSGAQNVLNLRSLHMSGHWARLKDYFRFAA